MKNVFDHLDPEKQKEAAQRIREEFAARATSLSRLVANQDFRSWFKYVNLEFCGSDFGLNSLDEFTQGKRAAMSFLKESLAIADGGPELCGEVAKAHFQAIGDANRRAANGDGK